MTDSNIVCVPSLQLFRMLHRTEEGVGEPLTERCMQDHGFGNDDKNALWPLVNGRPSRLHVSKTKWGRSVFTVGAKRDSRLGIGVQSEWCILLLRSWTWSVNQTLSNSPFTDFTLLAVLISDWPYAHVVCIRARSRGWHGLAVVYLGESPLPTGMFRGPRVLGVSSICGSSCFLSFGLCSDLELQMLDASVQNLTFVLHEHSH